MGRLPFFAILKPSRVKYGSLEWNVYQMEENPDPDPDIESQFQSSSDEVQEGDALTSEAVPAFTFEQGKISFSNRS
jgi:hypothetical protein